MKPVMCILFAIWTTQIGSAGLIFSSGNNPQTDEPVLFHDSCAGCVDGPGTLVIGHLQSSNFLVDLTSPSPLVAVGPGHNAVSTNSDGFTDLSIFIPGYSFSSIILQLTEMPSAPDGLVIFTAHTSGEGNFTSPALFVDHTGGTFYTITTTSPTSLIQLDLTTTELQHDISQIRIGGANAIPEPSTSALIGSALIGLAFFRRRPIRWLSRTSARMGDLGSSRSVT
jgi:hypothetical protein